jgi:adenylate cyclase
VPAGARAGSGWAWLGNTIWRVTPPRTGDYDWERGFGPFRRAGFLVRGGRRVRRFGDGAGIARREARVAACRGRSAEALARSATLGHPPASPMLEPPAAPPLSRRLAALLCADVVGYSRLVAFDDEGAARRLATHRDTTQRVVGAHGGRLVDFTGDAFLAEFPSALAATRCALALQQEVAELDAHHPPDRRLAFRMGLHLGDVVTDGERLVGNGVNVAARLQTLAEPGGICASSALYDEVAGRIEVDVEELGAQQLKNIPGAIRALRLRTRDASLAALSPSLATRSTEPSLAVLPFVNRSGDPEQEYFADGLTEDLTTELARLSGVFVTASYSSFVYKGAATPLGLIARELGVAYAVQGSVRKADDRVRISVQLCEAATGRSLWAERYDRKLADIFALQDDVVGQIVSTLRVRLREDESTSRAQAPTANLEAYDYYLRASALFYRTRQKAHSAEADLRRAVALDPDFAPAWALLAHTHFQYMMQAADPSHAEQTLEFARRAIALDPGLGRPYAVIGSTLGYQGRVEEALGYLDTAVRVEPSDPRTHTARASILTLAGRGEEALESIDRARRLDPHDSIVHFVAALAHYELAQLEAAIASLRRSIALNPEFEGSRTVLAACQVRLGDPAAAKQTLADAFRAGVDLDIDRILGRMLSGSVRYMRDPSALQEVAALVAELRADGIVPTAPAKEPGPVR